MLQLEVRMISCTFGETTSLGVLSVTPSDSVLVIFTYQKLLTFAQAEPVAVEAVEATLGNVVAALLVMSAMAGSLFMITIWWQRYSAGNQILPTATRKPLRVPLPLLIGGIVLSGMMALTVLMAVVIPEDMLQQPVDGDAAVVDVEQPAVAAAVAEADGVEGVQEPPDEIAAAQDGNLTPDENSDEGDGDEVAKKAGLQVKFHRMLWQTLTINAIMFCVFGVFTYLSQANHSRRSLSIDEVSYPSIGDAANHFFDEDALEQDLVNPYSGLDPFTDDNGVSQINPEPWSFTAELRFACETFLVAYLPTSVLRILIVKVLPDAPSHPFLEMLADGVDWNIMALIALMAVVVAPLVEELLYRVTVLGGLWQQHNLLLAWGVSSVLFSFAHGFPDSIALLPLAFAIGYTYIQRRSYRTVVLVHFLFNGFNMAIAGASML